MSNTVATTQPNTTIESFDFGDGRYSPLMKECFEDLQNIFKLDKSVAAKLSRIIGSEVGAIMRDVKVNVKVGGVNKDGKITLAEAAKLKGITATLPLSVLRALQFANEAMKNGFNRNETTWVPTDKIAEYIDSI